MRRLLVLLVVAVLGLTACAQLGGPRSSTTTGWSRLPDHPLSPRGRPLVTWTGTELLVVGGDTGNPCPPNAGCVGPPAHARDGAAYDPGTREWRPIASAPLGVPDLAPHAWVAGELFVLTHHELLAYSPARDRWRRVPVPGAAEDLGWYTPVADGYRLLLVSGSDEEGVRPDRVHDVTSGQWSVLPEDPVGPAFGRAIVPTPSGLVLAAHLLVASPGAGDRPSLVQLARLDRRTNTWTRLPEAPQLGGGYWWTGHRLVDPSLGSSDGGGPEPGDYGREIPMGGVLDAVTGAWSPLPDAPAELSGGWSADAADGWLLAAAGWVYDDRGESWTRLARPHADAPEQAGAATWADGTLVVVGGQHDDRGWTTAAYSRHVWAWTSPDRH